MSNKSENFFNMRATNRRDFVRNSLAVAGGLLISPALLNCSAAGPRFKISLAEWSFHKTLFAKQMTNLDFPVAATDWNMLISFLRIKQRMKNTWLSSKKYVPGKM
jgi:hypothetical protein